MYFYSVNVKIKQYFMKNDILTENEVKCRHVVIPVYP